MFVICFLDRMCLCILCLSICVFLHSIVYTLLIVRRFCWFAHFWTTWLDLSFTLSWLPVWRRSPDPFWAPTSISASKPRISSARPSCQRRLLWPCLRYDMAVNNDVIIGRWCIIGPTVFASNQLNTPTCSFFKQTMSILLKTTRYMTFPHDLEVPNLIFWS